MRMYRNSAFDERNLVILLRALMVGLVIVYLNLSYFTESSPVVKVSSYIMDYGLGEAQSQNSDGGRLAIIIDDFGQNREGVKEMMSIPVHLTFAIMPFLTFTQSDAHTAYEKGYEIIV